MRLDVIGLYLILQEAEVTGREVFLVTRAKPLRATSLSVFNYLKRQAHMQSLRTLCMLRQLPRAQSLVKRAPPHTTARTMSLFPRIVQNEFAPMFRMLDQYADYANRMPGRGFSEGLQSFNAKFVVKETKEAYELHGELPGVEQKDVTIEWQDSNTTSIKGRTEHSHEAGTPPAGFIEEPQHQSQLTEKENGHYSKATVEDEGAKASSFSNEGTSVEASKPKETNGSTYWFSEHSVGEFARTFSFPKPVDQDNVEASLKNGILSLTVPKTTGKQNKRIEISE
ncbi:uncharacterized protein LTR77_011234 [Saxophila tyrrhenica]|uniref:SHSP domain-containing protein n=1 Tax=Saxophila tyrrhenica TaxID=1690608 RepID=A0AAV9NX07_9PEZI|nr:hypothetical protein LTR77_011234 [Saxophila tyrrhenica]